MRKTRENHVNFFYFQCHKDESEIQGGNGILDEELVACLVFPHCHCPIVPIVIVHCLQHVPDGEFKLSSRTRGVSIPIVTICFTAYH
jgi:hypothetical protein